VTAGTASVLAVGTVAVALAGLLRPDRHGDGGRRDAATRRTGRTPGRGANRRRGQPRRSARWAGPGDLGDLVIGSRGQPPPGRLVLGRFGRRLVAAEAAQSVIVFGPTQSHKTSGLAVPAILGWEGPVVASSVKGDLLEHTIAHRRTEGEVQCFDPTGVTGLPTADWSPLPAARTWPGARRAAATLTEVGRAQVGGMSDGDFWYATASRLLAPLLFAAAVGRRDMADVVHWVETGEEDEVLDLLYAAGVPEAVDAARSAFGKEERQRSSIVTTLETLLEPFAGAAAEGRRPFDPAVLLAGSDTLYLCAPAHDQRRLTPLFVGVLRAVLDTAYDQVARTGRRLDPPLLVVLDEAANIAPLPDLDALAATAAGHGIQLVTIWHDLAQIHARFGPRATTVVNNHRAKLFLSGIADPATLDYASHLIGEEDVQVTATTAGGRSGASSTRSPTRRRLAPPDALRRTPPGRAVLVYRDLPPAQLALRTWFDDPWLRRRVVRHRRTVDVQDPTDVPDAR
jgi:type IV secretion system protein VirD4